MGRRLGIGFVFRFIFFRETNGQEAGDRIRFSFYFFRETNRWSVEGWRSMSDSFFVLFFFGKRMVCKWMMRCGRLKIEKGGSGRCT